MSAHAFPLSALVGQEALIEALLVNAVAPDVGGVLVRGERGTAKSTAVRALAPLLPPVHVAAGQPFAFGPGEAAPGGVVPADAAIEERPAPLVELPLGATLDRLVGALDLGRALAGEQAFEAGLLARAHRGILYVDEVNLLPDHLVDALLDAAASGVARVEREAVSAAHAARFLLVGTMNVEEGELRPQLLDRFGLGVEVRAPRDRIVRAEIVRRRLAFERDPAGFAARFAGEEATLAARIAAARALLPSVRLPERELLRITGACAELEIDGVRGDIVCARAAQALAALEGADEVTEAHVRRAAALALAHRRHRDPLGSGGGAASEEEQLQRALDGEPGDGEPEPDPPGGGAPPPPAPPERSSSSNGSSGEGGGAGDRSGSASAPGAEGSFSPTARARERRDPPAPATLPIAALTLDGRGRGPAGRRARGAGAGVGAIDARPARPGAEDLAIVATLRARLTSPMSGALFSHGMNKAPLIPLHEHVRAGREAVLLCLVVDASGSMGARQRLAKVKGALLELLRDAYARRDRVAVIAFRDAHAELLVRPGAPLEQAGAAIRALPTGGRTPLAEGLREAALLIGREAVRDPSRRAVAVVLTDGRVQDPHGAVPLAARALGAAASAVHVVDTEEGHVRLGLAGRVALAAGGQLHRLAPPPVTRTRRSAA
ncbi:VWA domain-containing protein [Conexibacter stalactiti]|uniref:Mg-protoporphyrin IX chelatase n=1 Tax=Conexibacter stalactiti TaxID=1940611 RepID=A0ABU4HXM4_9ACTN|nr:VWA domain-containing protein [Conexibacter stalactiti]MDW5597215.1 VWA domain-containing protein [Conexibacter stalactiti]MEC5037857.1 VWA domain-containing protein [Conexibacter stalactiti]